MFPGKSTELDIGFTTKIFIVFLKIKKTNVLFHSLCVYKVEENELSIIFKGGIYES